MSYLAIGATTQALVELLTRKLNKPALLGSAASLTVSTLPPDDDRVADLTGLNFYLYRISESPFLKNMDWRGDRGGQRGLDKPALAVSLNYLLTAYTKRVPNSFRDDVTTHQLLGNGMSILHDHPVLNDVHDSDFDADLDTHFAPELRDSFEKIKVTLVPTSMDELSKIWTGLAKAFRLSTVYEVSLVQIGPQVTQSVPRPPPRRAVVAVTTFGPPALLALEPTSGAVGSTIKLKGLRLASPGVPTSVILGRSAVSAESLATIGADEVVVELPDAPAAGPEVPVSVTVGGRTSNALPFEVVPWIDGLVPLRGTTGIPLRFWCDVPAGQTVSVNVGGIAAPASFDAASKTVEVSVPAGIAANGPAAVVATLSGPPPVRSNALSFEVLPQVVGLTLSSTPGPANTTLTVQGARLAGSDVEIRYGTTRFRKGRNTDPAEVQITVDRALAAGVSLSVIVDGHESNAYPPVLERVAPAAAFAGDTVTLYGRGLSGAAVALQLGALSQDLGGQPLSNAVRFAIPQGLAPGSVDVRLTVDGTATGSVSLTVNA